jgi:hypothetical protein
MSKKFFKKGDRIEWTYKHHLNGRSFTYITKIGSVIGMTGAVKNVRYVSGSMVKVLFDGNKHPCIKHVNEIKLYQP